MDNAICPINKIVVIAISCLLRGGTEQQTLLLVKALVESGYHVEVYCYFEYDAQMVDEFKEAGANVLLLKWSRDMGATKFLRKLSAVFRAKSPDIVHVQYMAPGFLPIIAAKFARVPVVLATVHYPGTSHGSIAHLLLCFGALLTDCFTCVSAAAEKSWFGDSFLLNTSSPNSLTARNHLTIPNAVDVDEIDKALAEKTPTIFEKARRFAGKTIIGTVARLSEEKGLDVLLKAFVIVRKKLPDVHLLIVGDGTQKDYLQKLAANLGIANSCTWLGRLPWSEAMGYLGLMDIVVVPSRFEGFGLAAIEAMACKKPVVASNVDGLAEIIQDGKNGFVVDVADVKGFVEKIITLLKDEPQRKKIGQVARKHVVDNYSYPIFRERIKILYKMF